MLIVCTAKTCLALKTRAANLQCMSSMHVVFFVHIEKNHVGLMRTRLRSMKKMLRLPALFSVLMLIPFFARPQLIKEEFTVPVFNDQFDDDRDTWRNMSTSDNLFLIQDGEYLLRRKNSASGYSIFPAWKNKSMAFSLVAAIKLEDSKNEDASVGLIFMAQEDASGAFIFEFNPKGQYRLKQLVGLSFKLLTGDAKTGGWVESAALNPLGQYNLVEIRTSKRNYDVYVNEKYLLSFTEIAYKTGDIGISIGAATKARVDFIAVKDAKTDVSKITPPPFAAPETTAAAGGKAGTGKHNEEGSSGTSDILLKLVDQLTTLKMENQSLRDSLTLVKKQLRAANAARYETPKEPK
jgi:hypothetical protein